MDQYSLNDMIVGTGHTYGSSYFPSHRGRTQYRRLRHTFESALLETFYENEVQVLMGHANKITVIYDDRSDEASLRFAGTLKPKIEEVLEI